MPFPFVQQGEGFPLALLHGFPLDAQMWSAQLETLSKKYRVIAIEFRPIMSSMQAMSDDVYETLRQLGATPCVLAGLSMGGYVAMEFASRHADMLAGLILLDTRSAADTPQQKEARNAVAELARTQGVPAVADLLLPRLVCPKTFSNQPETVHALKAMMKKWSAESISTALYGMRDRRDLTEDLSKINVPTQIIVGEDDAITPPAIAESLHAAVSGSTLEIITDAGHMSNMEQPEKVNKTMLAFMESVAKSGKN